MSRNQILWSFLLFFIAFLTVIAVIIGVNRFSQQKAPDGQDTSLLFGAIARSQSTGTLGYSSKLPSQAEAEQKASEACGNDCAIISWFQNACGAFAAGSSSWGANYGTTVEDAMLKAKETCGSQSSDKNCEVKLVVCSNGLVSKN